MSQYLSVHIDLVVWMAQLCATLIFYAQHTTFHSVTKIKSDDYKVWQQTKSCKTLLQHHSWDLYPILIISSSKQQKATFLPIII
jgi:hypothetical protein